MNILRLIGVLALAEVFTYCWDVFFKSVDFSNLYTQMLTFLVVDLLTIKIISLHPIQNLTRFIQVILYLSVITHVFGAYCWVSYGECVNTYDQSKDWIFYLELMAFAAYGTFNGGKRISAMVNPSGVHDLPSTAVNKSNN